MKALLRSIYTLSIWITFTALSIVIWPNMDDKGVRVLGSALLVVSWGLAGKLN